jgi:hypothetical protein
MPAMTKIKSSHVIFSLIGVGLPHVNYAAFMTVNCSNTRVAVSSAG